MKKRTITLIAIGVLALALAVVGVSNAWASTDKPAGGAGTAFKLDTSKDFTSFDSVTKDDSSRDASQKAGHTPRDDSPDVTSASADQAYSTSPAGYRDDSRNSSVDRSSSVGEVTRSSRDDSRDASSTTHSDSPDSLSRGDSPDNPNDR